MADNKNKERIPDPENPVTPRDYDPTHGKDSPHSIQDIEGNESDTEAEKIRYEDDLSDETGRPVSMRRPGEFIVPDDENVDGEWTLPTREHGGWNKALDKPLEEQIDEPETPGNTNNK